jgi:hypothetical protein
MNSANPPQIHHYIPEFYSKGWADHSGKVVRFDKPFDKLIDRKVFPSQVEFERNLYSIPGTDPDKAQLIEMSFFKNVDNDAADALRVIIDKNSPNLDVEIRIAWTRFMLSLMHRTPSSFHAMKDSLTSLISRPDSYTQDRYEKIRSPDDPKLFEDFMVKNDPFAIEKYAYSIIPKLMNSRKLGQLIISMIWGKIEIGETCHDLLLSDNPIVMSNGIGHDEGYILIPLNPKFILYCAYSEKIRSKLFSDGVGNLVKKINKIAVCRARHFIISENLKQKRFVEKHFGTNRMDESLEIVKQQVTAISAVRQTISH